LRDLSLDEAGDQGVSGLVRAPMHGKVLALLVARGDRVTRGQRLAIIEAMKMEHTLHASIDGTVTEITVGPNSQVAEGAKVLTIAPVENPPQDKMGQS
jgi:3-methylcrotonyl-CoA carboxylase alpha subunit